ncbi:hypothetical protein HYG77_35270 (plasmid) [Rhodococcus sp. ZPP]|uniref:hypothetical protein n=1 Tax=Rhodococcus sp. ZPP TaxID=2749906 RepID=UPI001AD861C5|nr:hypothetical protein [Rhodococcus sp. ZPP]QTJ70724.1 hypothetical protein HYG77_35270 [Rhodococcus sp. ZPP]
MTAQRLCLAAGPAMTILFLVGWFAGTKWLPAPSPMMSAEAVSEMYQENRFGFQIGFFLMIIAAALMAPWAVAMTMWTKKTESRLPVLTYTQLVSLGCSVAIFVILYIPWALAAFRAGEIDPEITQMLHEFGWFMFLFDVAPFSVWLIALGLGILWTPRDYQMLPRWSGYYCLVEAFVILPAIMIIFFKNGPYSYNGFLALWWPFGSFFVWVIVMTLLCWKALNRQAALDKATGIGVHYHYTDLDDPEASSEMGPVDAPNRSAKDLVERRARPSLTQTV